MRGPSVGPTARSLTVRATAEENAAIEEAAREAGLSKHTFMREALRMVVGLERLTPARMGFRIRRD